MKLAYSLNEYDYLQHQLYLASKSESIKKKRLRSWVTVTLCFVVLGLLFFESHNKFLGYYFLLGAVASVIFYPLYLKSFYKKHYQKFISENYKNCFDEVSTVIFSDDDIEIIDKSMEVKVKLSDVEKIVETGDHIYIRFLDRTGSLIIPKRQVQNFDNVRTTLQQLSGRLGVPFVTELNWKWK